MPDVNAVGSKTFAAVIGLGVLFLLWRIFRYGVRAVATYYLNMPSLGDCVDGVGYNLEGLESLKANPSPLSAGDIALGLLFGITAHVTTSAFFGTALLIIYSLFREVIIRL